MSAEEVDETKRGFLKKGLLGAGAIVLATTGIVGLKQGGLLPSSESNIKGINMPNPHVPDDPNRHWGFVIDLAKCNGCVDQTVPADDPTGERPRCTYACRKSHYLLGAEPPMYWIRVYELQDNPEVDKYYFPKPCQNCQDAPCKHVCPTGATFQREDGTILINQEVCIGCRICMAACPYETRFFWFTEPPPLPASAGKQHYTPEFPVPYTRGTVVKCDLCLHQSYNKQPPHCVSGCPQGAIYYGDFNEDAVSNGREIIKLHDTLNARGGYRFKEEEGTDSSCYYLPRSVTLNQLSVELDISGNLHRSKGKKSTIQVVAKDENGKTLAGKTILVGRKTNFGVLQIGESITNRSGKTNIEFDNDGETTIIVKFPETKKYSLKEVEYNGN